ncbi:MAG: hypothetical protein ABIT69_07030 [Sphingomicrobium sp.]
MAKDSGDKPKKKKKAVKAAVGGVKINVKATRKADSKGKAGGGKGKKSGGGSSSPSGFEAFARLADHPMIADLIAVGATAAVAAVAERGRTSGSQASGSHTGNAVKAAGKAAAAAIGRRLMTEYNAVKDSAADAAKKKS